jgi:signal transduction histidine kinase
MKAKRVLYSQPFKIIIFITCALLLVATAASALAAAFMVSEGVYLKTAKECRREVCASLMAEDGSKIGYRIVNGIFVMEDYSQSNLRFAVYRSDSDEVLETNVDDPSDMMWQETFVYSYYVWPSDEKNGSEPEMVTLTVYTALADDLPEEDAYSMVAQWVDFAYSMRYALFWIAGICGLLAIVCLILLLCSTGHRNDTDEIVSGPLTRVPLDLLLAVIGIAAFLAIEVASEAAWSLGTVAIVLLFSGLAVVGILVVLGLCVTVAGRLKQGGWWKNTVICYVIRLAVRLLKAFWHGCRKGGGAFGKFVCSIPLIWKTLLGYLAIAFVEFWVMARWWGHDVLLFSWIVEKIVLALAVGYFALVLRKLQAGGKALAAGDLAYQVDTSKMFWDFKQHGENLNSIAGGMSLAVDERMKSERLKTELITNVSHDIKTPLTSIINYADLITKEPTDNEKITEYCEVLTRQSERLKKLIEDLVEASKASTGNLEVLLAPCEVGVLLTQAAGEYEKRLADGNLTLVTRQPEHPVTILADGRRLWRVFDNLMNNICKYAQPGTRVFLTLEDTDGQAVISFKNISRCELDVSSDELLERFVRGDSSRSTEGSGLGLSIAQSLTELQNGTLALTIDGDLFKVTLRFSTIA